MRVLSFLVLLIIGGFVFLFTPVGFGIKDTWSASMTEELIDKGFAWLYLTTVMAVFGFCATIVVYGIFKRRDDARYDAGRGRVIDGRYTYDYDMHRAFKAQADAQRAQIGAKREELRYLEEAKQQQTNGHTASAVQFLPPEWIDATGSAEDSVFPSLSEGNLFPPYQAQSSGDH